MNVCSFYHMTCQNGIFSLVLHLKMIKIVKKWFSKCSPMNTDDIYIYLLYFKSYYFGVQIISQILSTKMAYLFLFHLYVIIVLNMIYSYHVYYILLDLKRKYLFKINDNLKIKPNFHPLYIVCRGHIMHIHSVKDCITKYWVMIIQTTYPINYYFSIWNDLKLWRAIYLFFQYFSRHCMIDNSSQCMVTA